MAELSNLLGAVYGDAVSSGRDPDGPPTPVEPAADERVPAVPAWADDEHLDAAFSQWKPGPSPEAHAFERAIVTDAPVAAQPLADDLAAALSEALVSVDPHEDAPVHADAPVTHDQPQAHLVADEDDDDEEDEHEAHAAAVLPFERRRAAAELSAAAGPLPLAPPPPVDAPEDTHEDTHEDEPVAAPAAAPGPVVARTWDRSDDDILPARRRGSFSLSLRRG